jgi:hypothetical protein
MAVATTIAAPPLLNIVYRGVEKPEIAEEVLRLG